MTTKKSRRKHLSWSWLRSEHFWLVFSGGVFLAILTMKHENWCGIASITCFALSLGLRIVDRMPGPAPTVKPSISKMYYR